MDVLYVHPKGEGHGWPESLPLFRGRGVHVHHERKARFRVKNLLLRKELISNDRAHLRATAQEDPRVP
jgi:hypothetical protein